MEKKIFQMFQLACMHGLHMFFRKAVHVLKILMWMLPTRAVQLIEFWSWFRFLSQTISKLIKSSWKNLWEAGSRSWGWVGGLLGNQIKQSFKGNWIHCNGYWSWQFWASFSQPCKPCLQLVDTAVFKRTARSNAITLQHLTLLPVANNEWYYSSWRWYHSLSLKVYRLLLLVYTDVDG